MTYSEAKAMCDEIEKTVADLNDALNRFPVGQMGLTPDVVKASPEYRAAKRAFDAAFSRQRAFNTWFVKAFANEYREERRRLRA